MTTPAENSPIDDDEFDHYDDFDYEDDACKLCDATWVPADSDGNIFVRHEDDCPLLAATYDKDDS